MGWVRTTGADLILVANDAVARDSMQKKLMQLEFCLLQLMMLLRIKMVILFLMLVCQTMKLVFRVVRD